MQNMGRSSVDDRARRCGCLGRMVNKVDTLSTQNALLWGVAWLIISTLGGWYYGLMPVSAVGYDVVAHLPLVWHLMLNLVVWLVSASLLYVVILLYNRKAKFVDSYGRLLFAHWPATLLLLPVVAVGKVKYAMFSNDFMLLLRDDSLVALLMALFCVVVVVWMLYWSYVAFRRAAGRGDWSTWASFIIGYYLANRVTEWAVEAIYRGIEMG